MGFWKDLIRRRADWCYLCRKKVGKFTWKGILLCKPCYHKIKRMM